MRDATITSAKIMHLYAKINNLEIIMLTSNPVIVVGKISLRKKYLANAGGNKSLHLILEKTICVNHGFLNST